MVANSSPVLELTGLRVGVRGAGHDDLLVRDVSFSVERGERVGIVGESGCGKSLTALSVLGLLPAGLDSTVDHLALRDRDGTGPGRAAIVTQDPMGALNPCFRIRTQLGNVVKANSDLKGRAAVRARCLELLELVGLPNPGRVLDAFPHALSGGMRQRVMIALALAAEPDVLIADEPTTAIDVTIQAQVIELLDQLCRDEGLALVLITHDMGVVANLCDSVIVMYGGEIVEKSSVTEVFARPVHPYTVGLLASVPQLDVSRDTPLVTIPGQVPSRWSDFAGCRFVSRCSEAVARCREVPPQLVERGGGGAARCWVAGGADVDVAVELLATREAVAV